jgi:DNA polymerase I-like protein with 3'-5' exonuclease and polymerase domains
MEGLFSAAEIAGMKGGVRPPAPKNYKLPTHFPSLSRVKRISLDLESCDPSLGNDMGPGWRRDAFIAGWGLAIGDGKSEQPEFAEYYPVRHRGGPNLDADRVFEWLRDELAFYTGEIVGANLLYDGDGYQYQDIIAPLAKWRDVQWAEALIDENAFNYQLERLSKKYLGHGKVTDELKALYGPGYKTRMHEVHPGHMRAYGIGDVAQPLCVLHHQEKELRKQKLDDLFDMECRLMPMLLYMRRRGQRIDMKAADSLHDQFKAKRAEELQAATKLVPIRGFELTVENFGKPTVVCAALDALGIKYPKTAAGNASIKDKWLENLEHPFGAHLAAANKYDKALETFVNGYVTDFQINGRVHAEFHPLRKVDDETSKNNGTVSGRFSSVHPNLQNIPSRDKVIGPLCRAMFIPEEGMNYFSGDYSQIEFRLLVHCAYTLAQTDPAKAAKLWGSKNGADIWKRLQHAAKARDMYINDPSTDFHNMVVALTGLARKYAKGINFGIAFTMGVDKLAREIGEEEPNPDKPGQMRPTKRAHEILKQYHDNVPFVKAVGQAMTAMAKDDGFIATLLGRRTHFDLWELKFYDEGKQKVKPLPYEEAKAAYGDKIARAMSHKSLNCYTQGGGADLMKTAMVLAWESGILDSDDLIISLTVHDELDGSVSPGPKGQERLRELQHIMETAIPISLPTTTEFKQGANWAETH